MERILVTTDFSEESKRAIDPAVQMAGKLGLGLLILHVVVDLRTAPQGAPLAPPLSAPQTGKEIVAAKLELAQLAEIVRNGAEPVDITTDVITAERVGHAIAEYAHCNRVSMIAISTHGRTGWRHWILGSITEQLCRQSPVPVVVYPRPVTSTQ